jgi:hypothetical protein
VTLFKESRFRDADFERAMKAGKLDHLLLEVGVQQKVETDNMLFDNLAPALFYRAGFSGCPTPPNYFQDWSGSGSGLWIIFLSTYTHEPSYQEDYDMDYWSTFHNLPSSVNGSSAAKRIINDHAYPSEVWCDPGGRQQIFFRDRWLYLPTEGYSNNICSLMIVWYQNITATSSYQVNKRHVGRVRLKDQDGEPVRLNKTAYQAMLVEYTFSMASV